MWKIISTTVIRTLFYRVIFPIYLYCDHKSILYLWGVKVQLPHRAFSNQIIITNFRTLEILGKPKCHLASPDIFSSNVTLCEANRQQLLHEEIPDDMLFYDKNVTKCTTPTSMKMNINNASYIYFYPIFCQQGNTTKTLRLRSDVNEHQVEVYHEDNELLATMQHMTDCFKLERP